MSVAVQYIWCTLKGVFATIIVARHAPGEGAVKHFCFGVVGTVDSACSVGVKNVVSLFQFTTRYFTSPYMLSFQ